MPKNKYYQVDVEKRTLLAENVVFYIQQATDIIINLQLRDRDGDSDWLSWEDESIIAVAKMLQREDHFIKAREDK